MRGFFYILLIILVVLYILSPFDLIPDLLPIYGWIDDTFLLGLLLYFLRRGRLPGFLINLKNILDPFKKKNAKYRHNQTDSTGSYGEYGNRQGRTDTFQKKTPFEILGVQPGASQEEIHAAYRRAVHAYHPDKVSHLGPELQELAKNKFVEIQEAYQELTGKNTT
ncbi:MAG: DnaJ domain-containing protein [Deltaproteobacteria bacterium]|nr:DnaJ domain-containing protein [Deltaproteobacteria bacterium]MBW2219845.1 DnaJ domain-containing protein [Deltaproteobacteria bacterium]